MMQQIQVIVLILRGLSAITLQLRLVLTLAAISSRLRLGNLNSERSVLVMINFKVQDNDSKESGMKFSNTKALTNRLLVALALAAVSIGGLSGIADAATCFTCHAPVGTTGTDMRPVESTYRNITTGSIKGSHAKHIPVATTLASACTPCHGAAVVSYNTSHRNGFINVPTVGYSKLASFPQNGSAILGTCSTASCHVSAIGTGYVPSPTWGTTSTCAGCHTGVGSFTGAGSSPTTGSHTKHIAASPVCNNCHTGATAGVSGGTAHIDGNIDVANGYTANVTKHSAGSGYSTCSTASCHVSAYGAGIVATTVWGAADCAACHSGVGAFTGTGGAPVTGSHTMHMNAGATCGSCHNGASATSGGNSHINTKIDVANGYPASITKHTANTGYIGTCGTAICHVSPYGTQAAPSPTWGTSGGCASCHNLAGGFTGTGSSPSTGNHTKHMAALAACADCHAGAVAGVTGGTAHLDSNIDVLNGYTANVTKHASVTGYNSTCSSTTGIACHASSYNSGAVNSPTWGTAPGCVACHSGASAFTGPGNYPTTGSHTKHQVKGALCADCHTGAIAATTGGTAHRDGNIDVINGYAPNVAKHTAGSGYAKCSTAPCHLSAYNSGVSGPTATWGTTGANCVNCHSGAGAFTGLGFSPVTGSHDIHMNAAYGNANCGQCHLGTVANSIAGTNHLDGNVDVLNGYTPNVTKHTSGSGYSTCSTASCHSDAYDATPVITPTWGVVSGCSSCHNGVGAFTGTGSTPNTGSHAKHGASTGCNSCHTGAIAGNTGGANHRDGDIDVMATLSYPANVTKHTAGSGYSSCSPTTGVCHVSPYGTNYVTTAVWGTPGCATCHNAVGAFTGTGSSPNTGSHTKHMAATFTGVTCGSCHLGAIAGTTGGATHANTFVDVAGGYTAGVTKHTAGTYAGKCTSASCHANPYATTGSITTPTWANASLGCGACHTAAGAFTGTGSYPTTGSHTKHQAKGALCADCHTGAIAATTGGTAHMDGNIDVTNGYVANVTKHTSGSGYSTCSTSVCHSPYVAATGATATWGTSTGACAGCHNGVGAFTGTGSSPATGSHVVHMADGATCGSCHSGAVSGTTGGAAHADGNIDVINGYTANVTKHTVNTGYVGSCSTSNCHGNGTSSPVWGTVSGLQTCLKCHGYRSTGWKSLAGATAATDTKVGAHFNHISSTTYKYSPAYACKTCHSGGINGPAYTSTGHNDTATPTEVLFTTLASAKGSVPTYSSATGTCSAVYCHGANMNSNVSNAPVTQPLTAPVWKTSFLVGGASSSLGNGSTTSGSGDCARCHGYPPMTADHATVTSKADCIGCHTHVKATGDGFTDASLHINGVVEATGNCTSCHAALKGKRVNIMQQFTSVKNSHHYQGSAKIDNKVCYACHWEANSDGSANTTYHGKSAASSVDLVVWGTSTTRPSAYTGNSVTYLSGGATASARSEMAKINTHCLGCHNDTNKTTAIFATDSGTPSKYSWEALSTTKGGFGTAAQSIASKYSDTTTTTWGKFTGNATNTKNLQTKALSAHGNASVNQRGWSTLGDNQQSTTAVTNFPNTSGSVAVLCFDCHNSHGSGAGAASANAVTSSYSSATGKKKGAILKDTSAGYGGYAVAYRPYSGGNYAAKNVYKAGAGLCFDCHNNASTGAYTSAGNSTPWGYSATFGATGNIHGYNDTPYFGKSGGVFAMTKTYTYKGLTSNIGSLPSMAANKGGHFGASSNLTTTTTNNMSIGGLCTPCHDPHGVSAGILTANRVNAVPLLKETFVTSPYKVDAAAVNTVHGGGDGGTQIAAAATAGYHIDQNTFQTATGTGYPIRWAFATSATTLQTLADTQFAGLCMKCHNKSQINSSVAAQAAAGTAGSWKSMTRIHNSVDGWASTGGGNAGNVKHAYTCSKCHATHNSRLPRLLVTNCLDARHKNRLVGSTQTAATIGPFSTSNSSGNGAGRFPGGGSYAVSNQSASAPGPWFFGTAGTAGPAACHESATAGGTTFDAAGTVELWNSKSPW
jgi:predicted CxxxxCH...CXXCH cytochrome family protein